MAVSKTSGNYRQRLRRERKAIRAANRRSNRTTDGERITTWWTTRPVVALLGIFLSVASAMTTFAAISHKLETTVFRTSTDERRVSSLRAGMTQDYIESKLGPPVLIRASGAYTEHIFNGPGWWAQTISDEHGRVLQYAISACKSNFEPTFVMNGTGFGQSNGEDISMTLNHDSYAQIQEEPVKQPISVWGRLPNPSYFEPLPRNEISPSWYVGFNPVCSDNHDINERSESSDSTAEAEEETDSEQPSIVTFAGGAAVDSESPADFVLGPKERRWRTLNLPNTLVCSVYFGGEGPAPADFEFGVDLVEVAALR